MISRRQFLRACMYAAPAAIVAPKAITYFLPPRLLTYQGVPIEWDRWPATDRNIVIYGEHVGGTDHDIIELVKRRMNEAQNSLSFVDDEMARQIYRGHDSVTALDRAIQRLP